MAQMRHRTGLVEYTPDQRSLRRKYAGDLLDEVLELAQLLRLHLTGGPTGKDAAAKVVAQRLAGELKVERKARKLNEALARLGSAKRRAGGQVL